MDPSMSGRDLRLVLACNPRSGRGSAVRAAAAIESALDGAPVGGRTCRIERWDIGPGRDIRAALPGADALVIAGGDGSVHFLAPAAIDAGVPVYHIPCGNENLMAREFGMTGSPAHVRRALERWRISRMDVAEYRAGERRALFLLMCSLGPDAGVISRLHQVRTRALGHAAYAGPILSELRRPRFATVSAAVDGEQVIERRCGVLIVANSRQYAMRIDPAAGASPTDGLLDLVFLPCRTRAGMVLWAARSRARMHGPGAVHRRGRHFLIQTEQPTPYQVDGECPSGGCGMLTGTMSIQVSQRTLAVLA